MPINERWTIKMDDKIEPVMLSVHQGKSIRVIANELGKSIGTVQSVMEYLEEKGYMVKSVASGKKTSRSLTKKGKEYLSHAGHTLS